MMRYARMRLTHPTSTADWFLVMIGSEILMDNVLVGDHSLADSRTLAKLSIDELAFQVFYKRTARPLWAYLCRLCGDAVLADDLLQDTYIRFLKVPDLKPEESLRKAYLFKIATNLVTDHWRRSKREQQGVFKSPSDETAKVDMIPSNQDVAHKIILGRDMSRIFGNLKPVERSLLWLAYVEGADHREIAGVLGLKEKSIRVMLFRARQKLAQLLRQKGIAPGGKS